MLRKALLMLLVVLALAALAAGCGGDEEAAAPGADTAATEEPAATDDGTEPAEEVPTKEQGVLKVGAEFPSGIFIQLPRDNPTGLEVDIANEIAKRLGIERVEWIETPFTSLFSPARREFDFAINEISITEERDEVVDFSIPYYEANQALLARKGGPGENATTMDAVRELQLGVQATTTGFFYAQETIKPTKQLRQYETLAAANQALLNGQYDAMIMDVPIAADLANENPDKLVIVGQFVTDEEWGILFEEGNPLRDRVNAVLQDMLEDGTIDEIVEKWLPGSTGDFPTIEG